MNNIQFRYANDEDMPFVFDTWLKSYKKAAHQYLDWNNYVTPQLKVINALIARGAQILVACNPDSPEHIFGYIVFEHINSLPIIHWIYTKFPFRRQGVAKSLITQANIVLTDPILITAVTYIVPKLTKKGWMLKYARNLLPQENQYE